jgi:hypothetical protein
MQFFNFWSNTTKNEPETKTILCIGNKQIGKTSICHRIISSCEIALPTKLPTFYHGHWKKDKNSFYISFFDSPGYQNDSEFKEYFEKTINFVTQREDEINFIFFFFKEWYLVILFSIKDAIRTQHLEFF